MDSFRRENEKVTAIGNMKVNARGDQIDRGQITKTSDQLARENHRIQSAIINTGLKGPQPKVEGVTLEQPKQQKVEKPQKVMEVESKKTKETELPSGDIIIDRDNNEN
jgi:hypothetical protein